MPTVAAQYAVCLQARPNGLGPFMRRGCVTKRWSHRHAGFSRMLILFLPDKAAQMLSRAGSFGLALRMFAGGSVRRLCAMCAFHAEYVRILLLG